MLLATGMDVLENISKGITNYIKGYYNSDKDSKT